MINRKWLGSNNSLPMKLALSVLIMTLPLVGMLLYNNFYAIQVVREQVALSYYETLSHNMNQIDDALNAVDAYMNTIAFSSELLSVGQNVTDEDYYAEKYYLFNKLKDDIALYPILNAFVVYEEDRQDFLDVPSNRDFSFEEMEHVKDFIAELIHSGEYSKDKITKRWQNYEIGQDNYLIDIVQAGDAYLSAWIRSDKLVSPPQSLKTGKETEILLANDQGEAITNTTAILDNGIDLREDMDSYYLSGTDQKFLVVDGRSAMGDFSLVTLIPDQNILSNLPYLQRIIWLIMFGALIFIPLGLYLLRKSFLVPLNRILVAMKRVREGDWSIQVDMGKTSSEFTILGQSFNAMMTEIQKLRVDVFEEQLNKQREELQRLQQQVNPHFFLNALNIVYNLAKVKNYGAILEMIESLMHYFRFLFRSTTSFVKLRDELEHTRNYLKIQNMRFPGQLTWSISVPEYLMDIPVPPLIIQSIVENSIKHAVTLDDPLHITVQIDFFDKEVGSRMMISIKDTGCGFGRQVLSELQEGKSIQNDKGEHTGIWNVQRRVCLLYDESVSIHFDNDEETGGAKVDMILPTDPRMEEMT